MQKRRQNEGGSRNLSSTHNRAGDPVNSKTLGQRSQGLHKFKPGKMAALGMGSGHKGPLLTKNPYAIDVFWERKRQFPPVECLCILTTL